MGWCIVISRASSSADGRTQMCDRKQPFSQHTMRMSGVRRAISFPGRSRTAPAGRHNRLSKHMSNDTVKLEQQG
eukprot:scaffold175_cov177-Amphora_coffeaeformis.AAC.12